jgi:hypothetical protein
MALSTLTPTPAAGKAIPYTWFEQLLAAINATGNNVDVTYGAGNFTASGSQTWTVDSGDVGTNTYWRFEKAIVWALTIDTSSVGGTPSSDLKATIPLGLIAAKTIIVPMPYLDNGTYGNGIAIATSGQTVVRLLKNTAGTNWTASTNNTSIYLLGIRIPTTT